MSGTWRRGLDDRNLGMDGLGLAYSSIASLKPKDLVGLPWLLAFALRADGWYLRSDIIWHKPNPMPESVTDRPTKAHEYVFLLTKSARYWYDAAAIAEPVSTGDNGSKFDSERKLSVHPNIQRGPRFGGNKYGDSDDPKHATKSGNVYTPNGFRNVRSVWTIPTQGYSGAHFATFPEELAARCIKAGCPAGGVVLDPFGGSGTTAEVALKLGRRAVLIELNPEYVKLIRARLHDECPLLAGDAA